MHDGHGVSDSGSFAVSPSEGPGLRVARIPREHEAVDDERVLARLEQLAEPHLAAVGRLLEAVVVRDDAARRQRTTLRGDLFDRPPQPGLGFQ